MQFKLKSCSKLKKKSRSWSFLQKQSKASTKKIWWLRWWRRFVAINLVVGSCHDGMNWLWPQVRNLSLFCPLLALFLTVSSRAEGNFVYAVKFIHIIVAWLACWERPMLRILIKKSFLSFSRQKKKAWAANATTIRFNLAANKHIRGTFLYVSVLTLKIREGQKTWLLSPCKETRSSRNGMPVVTSWNAFWAI